MPTPANAPTVALPTTGPAPRVAVGDRRGFLLGILAAIAVAFPLAWIAAPVGANALARALAPAFAVDQRTLFFALDLVLSFAAFCFGSWVSASTSGAKPFHAGLPAGALGCATYFVEAGGFIGFELSPYPLWYEYLALLSTVGGAAAGAWILCEQPPTRPAGKIATTEDGSSG